MSCSNAKHRDEELIPLYLHAIDIQEPHEEHINLQKSKEETTKLAKPNTTKIYGEEFHDNKNDEISEKGRKWQLIQFVAFFFFTGGAPAVLTSYLPVYYRQLGLNPHQIGVVQSLQPWISIPAIPLWGYLADRFNATRSILIFTLGTYLVSHVALAFTPPVAEVDCVSVNARWQDIQDKEQGCSNRVNTRDLMTASSLPINHLWNSSIANIQGNGQLCSDSEDFFYDVRDLQLLYLYLIVINAVGILLHAPSTALGNAEILNCLGEKNRNQYGYYKSAGAIAACIGLLVAGLSVDATEETYVFCGVNVTHASYIPCFVMFGTCMAIAIPVAWTLPVKEKSYLNQSVECHYFRDILRVLVSLRYGTVYLAITWLAIAIGVAKAFDFWYIKSLGGSHTVIAWSGMIGCLVQFITFIGLPHLNHRYGHLPFLVVALFTTAIGCCVSAFIEYPGWMIIPMCLRGIATAIAAQSAGAYLADAVDKDQMATLQAIMAASIDGVGNGAGSLFGGILINIWSIFTCYIVFAIATSVFLCILIIVWCYEVRRQ
ncbi:major facilitator superfamily domain-containing protein 6-like [Amphiura filiformis]|uniref:major facilitator superfamily domain-containing protein 6-like n=1 Tax=Amphiura filiformis TaxID=82378 RepID=UPI003B21E446